MTSVLAGWNAGRLFHPVFRKKKQRTEKKLAGRISVDMLAM